MYLNFGMTTYSAGNDSQQGWPLLAGSTWKLAAYGRRQPETVRRGTTMGNSTGGSSRGWPWYNIVLRTPVMCRPQTPHLTMTSSSAPRYLPQLDHGTEGLPGFSLLIKISWEFLHQQYLRIYLVFTMNSHENVYEQIQLTQLYRFNSPNWSPFCQVPHWRE